MYNELKRVFINVKQLKTIKTMKKLTIFAFIGAFALVSIISSCKKESGPLAKPSYDKSDLKSIIKLANPTLYKNIYSGLKTTTTTIYITYGVLKDPAFECLENPSVICSVVVIKTGSKDDSSGGDPIVIPLNGGDYTYTSTNPGDGVLILAEDSTPVSYDIKSVNITDASGTPTISYATY